MRGELHAMHTPVVARSPDALLMSSCCPHLALVAGLQRRYQLHVPAPTRQATSVLIK